MIVVICTLPLILAVLNFLLHLFLNYVEWGQNVFGFEDKSFGLILYTFGTPVLVLFILYKIVEWLERKLSKGKDHHFHK
jgi:hypothetical protein